jgi:hypothetical protein
MPAPQLTQEVRPTVIFRNNASPNEALTKKEGRPIYDDMEVCDIFFPGMVKERVPTCRALDQADWFDDPIMQTKRPRTYMEKYAEEYQAFKAGVAQSSSGTPIEELPFLTEGKRLELKHGLKIYTAEQLAGLDGGALKALGPGGREMAMQAQAYLDMAKKGADATHLRDELADRDAKLAAMQAQIDALLAAKPTSNDSMTAGEKMDAEDPQWSTFVDEDIANMLTQAGVQVDGRWGRKTLIEKAEAIIAAKKKAA